METLQERIDSARRELEAAEQAVRRLDGELQAARERITTARQRLRDLEDEQARLPNRLGEAEREAARRKEELDAAEGELQRLRKVQARLEKWGQDSADRDPQIKDQEKLVRERQEALRLARERAEGVRRRQAALPAEISAARRELEAAEQAVGRLEGELKAARESLTSARAAADETEKKYEELLEERRKRFLYPPTAGIQAMESIAANSVVDGLALLRLSKKPGGIPWGGKVGGEDGVELPREGTDPIEDADYLAIIAELQALDEAVDAISDAVTAESVYHMAQGNPLRSGATLDAVASGEVPPPELEVARTPRSGIALTHRILVLFSGAPDPDDPHTRAWTTNAYQARAQAEPRANAWAARLLGDPSRVRCRIEYLDPQSGDVLGNRELRLSELELSPLDMLYLTHGDAEAQRSELEQRLVHHLIRSRPNDIPVDARVRLTFARGDDWEANDVSFAEFLEVARTAAKVVAGARAIDARDLSPPEDVAPIGVDTEDLKGRASNAVEAFRQARTDLWDLLKIAETASLEDLRDVLLRMAHFGVQGAVPLSPEGDAPEDRETLLAQARSIEEEVGRRLEKIRAAEIAFERDTAPPSTAAPEARQDHDLGRLREVFGADFRVLPRFRPANATELDQAFARSDAVQDDDPLAVVTWFQRIARIRDGAANLDAALVYAEILGSGATLDFKVGQLPYQEDDRWVALRSPDEPIAGGRLSLVAHVPTELDLSQPLAGLFVDEWVEVVPNTSETTAVAFHFDEPGARAPQAILLAVPPDDREVWDLATLEAILLETLELAKLRAVDPDALAGVEEVGHFLPALYSAINLKGDTVSTDFTRAATKPPEPGIRPES